MRTFKVDTTVHQFPSVQTELVILAESRTIDMVNLTERVSPLGQTYSPLPNDVGLFIKQQKILKYNPTVVQEILQEFRASSSPLSDALKGVSDADIMDSVKSRYIQSTGDLHRYAESMQDAFFAGIEDIRSSRAAAAASEPPAQPAAASE